MDQIYRPQHLISEIDFFEYELHCQEVLTTHGKSLVRSFYLNNPAYCEQHTDCCLKTLLFATSKEEVSQGRNALFGPVSEDASSDNSSLTALSVATKKQRTLLKYDFVRFQSYFLQNYNEVLSFNLPSEIIIVAYNRRFVQQEHIVFANV